MRNRKVRSLAGPVIDYLAVTYSPTKMEGLYKNRFLSDGYPRSGVAIIALTYKTFVLIFDSCKSDFLISSISFRWPGTAFGPSSIRINRRLSCRTIDQANPESE